MENGSSCCSDRVAMPPGGEPFGVHPHGQVRADGGAAHTPSGVAEDKTKVGSGRLEGVSRTPTSGRGTAAHGSNVDARCRSTTAYKRRALPRLAVGPLLP